MESDVVQFCGQSVFCNILAGPGVGLDLGKALANVFAGFDWSQ